MRRWLLLRVLAAASALLLAGTAVADNGPHVGDFPKTTDACAGCHRAHRGYAEKLLKEASQQALCYSCHGTAGTGADTNVEDGIYLERDGVDEEPDEGEVNASLRGGGFDNAVMDPDLDGTPESAPVTSKHNVGETGLTIWGSGAITSTVYAGKTGVTLECGSCHNPHGFKGQGQQDNVYRILRPEPRDSDVTSGVWISDEPIKNYTITYHATGQHAGYRNVSYLTKVISDWCAQCHTRYLSAQTQVDSGDAIFKYRHNTADSARKCVRCHVAHGTSATMGPYSGDTEWPDGTTGGGSTDSRLLHVDNRGVCMQCHPGPGGGP